ncbi:mitochondrial import inner membrane translocase subunit Tim9 isoform X2 [Colius striatus]|uniref:mitochondrial import inner membrane translocase subunit Tim9 isoform X2 n=1 Tax=Colius striatus TaxID=57412 RepID=UPI002B1D84DD|nr:mitochondrial import inner membrane translocase subunit Tim9 isoform X2 [Colius striatus]
MAGQISESDQIKQFKEFLGTYNKLTENCFLDCVKDFTSREVKPEENLPLLGDRTGDPLPSHCPSTYRIPVPAAATGAAGNSTPGSEGTL